MIELSEVGKIYETRCGPKVILERVGFSLEKGGKLGILGGNGAGKSTLIRLISGAELPSSGHIRRDMSVSWPLAFGGAFQGSLTGFDNIRFICRIYDVEIDPAISFVKDFSELGGALNEPVKHYSSGMRSRLAFAISLAIEFDCFLIDEIVAVGDSRFQEKCRVELFQRRRDRAIILVSHDPHYIKEHCDRAAVLEDGRLTPFDSVATAFKYYNNARAG